MPIKDFEAAYLWASLTSPLKRRIPIETYIALRRQPPTRIIDIQSAWRGLENVLEDILTRFDIKRGRCLEFGVEYGFSTAAFSSFFQSVVGVDTFQGDRHTGNIRDIYTETLERLRPFANIRLVRAPYQEFILNNEDRYDLIHVDIIHTYADTFRCGLWSAQHSDCTLFHDTESFPAVKQALVDIARKTGKTFHNFTEFHGLGILV